MLFCNSAVRSTLAVFLDAEVTSLHSVEERKYRFIEKKLRQYSILKHLLFQV